MAYSDAQAQNLLELELDRRTYFRKLIAQVLGVSDGGWELSGWKKFDVNPRCRDIDRNDGKHLWRDRAQEDEGSA
jgi:hypothetical protein